MNNDKYRIQIGKDLAARRLELGMTLKQLSEITGIENGNISRIEKGKYNTGIDLIGKLADALGVDIKLIEK